MDETYQIVNTLLYESDEGAVSIEVVIDKDQETMWANQKTMAGLYLKFQNQQLVNILKIFLKKEN